MSDGECPYCRQSAVVPSLTTLTAKLSPMARAVLGALWDGGGRLVKTNTLFDAMFADDPDGGPEDKYARRYLRRAISEIEQELSGTGVAVIYHKHAGSWRIVIGV